MVNKKLTCIEQKSGYECKKIEIKNKLNSSC